MFPARGLHAEPANTDGSADEYPHGNFHTDEHTNADKYPDGNKHLDSNVYADDYRHTHNYTHAHEYADTDAAGVSG